MSTTKESIESTAAQLGITMTHEFIPWSKSRNAHEKMPSLNWKVTLHKGGKAFLTTDYMAGSGHCPSYRNPHRNTIAEETCVKAECETGWQHFYRDDANGTSGAYSNPSAKRIVPCFADVLDSLASDASVLDCSSFEQWAEDLGYDTDSRKAERIYRDCIDIALKLRNALGERGLSLLREACQDY